jgi:ribonucleotide reductase beta subunit family protein with ferritin-like domain
MSKASESKEEKPTQTEERLFKPTDRISAVPLDPDFADIWANYEVEQSSFWPHNKIKFTEDIKAFPNAPQDIQESTLKVLGYFAGSDEIVEEIIQKSPLSRITVPEIRYILNFEAMMENIHSTVYNKTIQAVVPDAEKRRALFRAIETMPSVRRKALWARQWIRPDKPLGYTLIGKACTEAINFSSSFAWIDWLKTQNYRFDGMYEANDEISRDEARHVDTSVLLYKNHVKERVTPDNAKEIIDGSVEIEMLFVEDVISPRGYVGMNRQLMREHIQHCAALLATDLGYDFYRNTASPFKFMTMRSLNSKTNFFEKRETNYSIFESAAEAFDDAFDENAAW